ncbi:MAG: hypothetical protein L0271_23405 [Gemmatimonadetes bacterium]|nr:hypothetical protein [Gemmatimonadota bacterium]
MTRTELRARIDTIEQGYEFLLAFAAQGARDDRASPSGAQLRNTLGDMAAALGAIPDALVALIRTDGLAPAASWNRLHDVLSRDAAAALAALELVRARSSISSQIIDNLNASMHLRALLTDLFLLDDLLQDT